MKNATGAMQKRNFLAQNIVKWTKLQVLSDGSNFTIKNLLDCTCKAVKL